MFEESKPPVDIFADVDKAPPGAAGSEVVTPPVESHNATGPSKLLLGVIVLAVFGLGGGGYFFFAGKSKGAASTNDASAVQVTTMPEAPAPVAPIPEPMLTEQPAVATNTNTAPEVTSPAPTEPVQPPEAVQKPADADGDGLSDAEEAQAGTNPQSADTDQDGLNDNEELKTWRTDPKNPDTDGDGYLDGQEVKGGFNPNGPGKLFEVPK